MSNIEDMEIIDSLRRLLKEEPSIDDISTISSNGRTEQQTSGVRYATRLSTDSS